MCVVNIDEYDGRELYDYDIFFGIKYDILYGFKISGNDCFDRVDKLLVLN